MDEPEAGQPHSPTAPLRAGEMLRAAREAHGLPLAEVASRTRVPLRHLEALEAGDYAALPSPTYAVGFAKAYARAVGADEVAVGQATRAELDRFGPRQPEYVPYETADPARVPSRGVTIVALGVALAVFVLAALWYGTTLLRGTTDGGGTPIAVQTMPSAASAPAARATPAAPTGGQVSFVAKNDVWLRVYDADDKTLYLGTLKPGERYDVPADARDPMINVGRPDQLDVTLDGRPVPPLGTGERAIKDVRVGGAAIAARLAGTPAPAPSATPAASSTQAASVDAPRRTQRSERSERPREASRPARSQLSETQRANLDAAANPPAGNASAP